MTDHKSELRPDLETKLSELSILKESLDEARQKERDVFDQLLRLGAEFDNFRKRSETRVQDARKAGREEVLLDIIQLADSLVQAELASGQAQDLESLKKGLSLVFQQFQKFLNEQGVIPVKSVGEKLDPHLHEAIAQVENAEAEDGVITDEIQRGYLYQERLLRPARVRVSVKPSVGSTLSESKED